MPLLRLVLASGEHLEVHHFSVREEIASLFTVKLPAGRAVNAREQDNNHRGDR
ncbi:MAG TPA: hypothetical protein VLS89_10885 [Candidatus Nanopelagicales bacterium]|nr:hypothetical protein [Candidatus Nanopelagicales bacterium]